MNQSSDPNSTLGELAWRICANKERAPVLVDHPEERSALQAALSDGRLLEDDRGVRFADEHAMVLAATEHFLRTEADRLLASPRACFEQLDDVFSREIGKQHRVSGCALAELHNAERLDGFAWGRQAIEAGVGVFDVLHVMEGAVPLFTTARAPAIYDFFAGHYERVKNDLAGGILYAKLPSWLAMLPDIARALKQIHEASPQETSASLYACALHGLILQRFDDGFARALDAACSPTPTVSGPALHMLGRVDYTSPPHIEALEQVIKMCTDIIRTPGHVQLGTATRTLGRLLPAAEMRIHPLLEEAAKTEHPEALYALSETLFQTQEMLRDREWFWLLYLRLSAAKAEHKGILDNIDMVLMGWIRHPERQERVLEFLNAWIANQPLNVIRDVELEKLFDATLHELKGQSALLNRAVTAWLLHDDGRYPLVAQKLVSRLRVEGVTSLELDAAIINDLTQDEIRFLLRRILGYIVGDDVQIRLVFSLVRVRDAKNRTFGFVTSVLQDQVGHDYPYQTIKFLEERQSAENEPEEIKTLCKEIRAELQSRLDALHALPDLKEFRPSSMKSRQFSKERHRQMNEAMEEASKDSIWRQITTHIPLKAGRRTFQTINGRYTDPMELKGMSHSVALPRSEISDPAGAARDRLLYRRAKKDSP